MAEKYEVGGRGPEINATFTAFAVLTTIFIALRVYVRAFMLKGFGLDDWTAVFGWLMFMGFAGFGIAATFHGNGQHVNLILPPENLPIGLKYWWVCEPIYVICNMSVKLSIALMLLRVVVEPVHRWTIYIVVGILEVYSISYFFLFVWQCTPPSFFWTRAAGNITGRCLDATIIVTATYVWSGITCVVDWTLALLPWLVIRKLQMTQRSKLLISIVLALGSIASIATIVRIPYVRTMRNTEDFLWATTDVAIWSSIEIGLSITASSAATLKPLFKAFLSRSRLFGSNSKTRDGSQGWPRSAAQAYVRTGPSVDSKSDDHSEITILKTFQVDVQRT